MTVSKYSAFRLGRMKKELKYLDGNIEKLEVLLNHPAYEQIISDQVERRDMIDQLNRMREYRTALHNRVVRVELHMDRGVAK